MVAPSLSVAIATLSAPLTVLLTTLLAIGVAAAPPVDRYPESLLYDRPVQVAPGVYSAIGFLGYYTYESTGHNNNLSFVVGSDSVLVVNSGSAYLLAEALHEEIRRVTELPVKYVVNENGQTHASAGNSYWRGQGAEIIAHRDAVEEIEQHGASGIARLQTILRERSKGTELAEIDIVFDEKMAVDLGGVTAELLHLGPAHSPGDIAVLIPERGVLIAGDIAFHQRMLPVFPNTNTKQWLETWRGPFTAIARDLTIIPGHGAPTDFEQVDAFTRGYLEYLRGEVQDILADGGSIADAYDIDQSAYSHLEAADELAGKNAGRIFEEIEWEAWD